jgi:hypothetical protein
VASWTRSARVVAAFAVAVVAGAGATFVHQPRDLYPCGAERLTESQIAARFGVTTDTLRRSRITSSVSYEALCDMPERLRARALRKADHPKPDHPDEAVAFRNLSLRNESGEIPEGALLRAKAHMDRLRASPDVAAAGAGLARASWTSLGPGNVGGRIRSILIDPRAPSTMLVGSVSGGIWRTTNAGASWAPAQDFMANLAVSTMTADPDNFDTIYAGTGEGFYNEDGIRGAGIFKSLDAGVTWTQLAATNNANFHYVNRVAISADGATLLAATRTGVYRSIDGGASFAAVLTGSADGFVDVDFDPSNASRAIVSSFEGAGWYSTNGGATFTRATGLPAGPFTRVEIAYAPSSPNIVYASADLQSGALYRSTDGGATYAVIGDPVGSYPDYLASQGWYDNALFVDPTNPDIVIVGGIDLYRSTNGGETLRQISSWWASPTSAHADHHVIVASPAFNGTTNRTVYFGNDGGIYGTTDVYALGNNASAPFTNGWQEFNNSLGVTQFYGLAVHASTGKAMGGTQDNGTLTYTPAGGSEAWVAAFGGDGGFSAIDQTNANYCYGEYVFLAIHRSTSGCGLASATYIYTSGLTDASTQSANFVAPFVLDPNNQARLIAGGRSLWRTENARAATVSWGVMKAPTTGDSYISAIAVQEFDSNHIWVGHNNGDVYKTVNGTAASPVWSKVDGTALPAKMVTRLAIDKSNPMIVYATFGGFQTNNIWKTIDGGATWTNLHGLLPAAPIRTIAIHPANTSWLYLGTEVGVFTSENGGTTWILPHDGPANVSVDELVIAGTYLYAATHGRGVFRANLDVPVPGAATPIAPTGYVGTASPTFRWHSVPTATWYLLRVDDPTGNRVQQWYQAADAGCAGGGVCEARPAVTLTAGLSSWRVQTWSSAGYGAWSAPLGFDAGYPVAEVTDTYETPDTRAGYLAPLWVLVRNAGAFTLPTGTEVWVRVTGPGGYSNWAGHASVAGLAPSGVRWVLIEWDVPIARTAGVHGFTGQVWSSTYQRWISAVSAAREFTILAALPAAARIVSTYPVNGAVPGAAVRTWTLVRNTGTGILTGRLWIQVYQVGWIGWAEVVNLASGAEQWYFVDWTVPPERPAGTHWYQAQVWNGNGSVAYSPLSAWQAFTVGVNAQFNVAAEGWTAVKGTWSLDSAAYLVTPGEDGQFASIQYSAASFTNFEFTVRMWRNGDNASPQGVYVRGTPTSDGPVWKSGYLFQYRRDGTFSVVKYVDISSAFLQGWTTTTSIRSGNDWNLLSVRAAGDTLTFSINGNVVWSGSDAALTSGQVGIAVYKPAADAGFGFWVDSAVVTGYGNPATTRSSSTDVPSARPRH